MLESRPCRSFARVPAGWEKWISPRARRVLLLLVGLWILNLFDLGMTLRASADGMLEEQNPLARAALSHSPVALMVGKLTLLLGASYVLLRFRARPCTEYASAFLLLVYVGVAFQWKFCYDMYEIMHNSQIDSGQVALVDTILKYLPIF
jgi:hypothetical protein